MAPYRTKASDPMKIRVTMTVEEVRRACVDWFENNSDVQPDNGFDRSGFLDILHDGVPIEGAVRKKEEPMFEFVWTKEVPE